MIAAELPAARRRVRVALTAYSETPGIDLDVVTYSADEVLGDWLP